MPRPIMCRGGRGVGGGGEVGQRWRSENVHRLRKGEKTLRRRCVPRRGPVPATGAPTTPHPLAIFIATGRAGYDSTRAVRWRCWLLWLHATIRELPPRCLQPSAHATHMAALAATPVAVLPHLLVRDKHVWHVLVLAQEGEVQQNLEGLRVGGHDDQLGNPSVQCLCGCGGTGGRARLGR